MARPPGARWFWLPGSPDFGGPRLLPNAGQQVGSRATAKLVKACATESHWIFELGSVVTRARPAKATG